MWHRLRLRFLHQGTREIADKGLPARTDVHVLSLACLKDDSTPFVEGAEPDPIFSVQRVFMYGDDGPVLRGGRGWGERRLVGVGEKDVLRDGFRFGPEPRALLWHDGTVFAEEDEDEVVEAGEVAGVSAVTRGGDLVIEGCKEDVGVEVCGEVGGVAEILCLKDRWFEGELIDGEMAGDAVPGLDFLEPILCRLRLL